MNLRRIIGIMAVAAYMAAAAISARGGEPHCSVRFYDGDGVLRERAVKQVATDRDGVVWLATWNGLVRYDGYEFAVVRPSLTDSVRRYSSRFRDLRTAADGRLWCRIDDRIVRFDPSTNRFEDIHSAIERRLGKPVAMRTWRQTAGLDTLVIRDERGYIIVPDANPEGGVSESVTEPQLKYASKHNRRVGNFGPYDHRNQAYGRRDANGRIWIVTRDGEVVSAPGDDGEPRVVATLGADDGSVRFCEADSAGGLWFRSSLGAHRIELDELPFGRLGGDNRGRVLACARDSRGRLWVAEAGRRAVAVYDSVSDPRPRYLTPLGTLSDRFTAWGRQVYSLARGDGGTIWAGTKPDGLFRLTPDAGDGKYEVSRVCNGNIYDILPLGSGRLAIATLGEGLKFVDDAYGPTPRVSTPARYPRDAMGCRRLKLTAPGSDTILVATTGGLLCHAAATGEMNLMVTEVGRASSLGCIAVTDIARLSDGRVFVSTESDGINALSGNPMGEAVFRSLNDPGGNLLDVATTVVATPAGKLLVMGTDKLYTLDPDAPDGAARVYGEAYWREPLRFTDMRPLHLADGLWLIGTETGAITVRPGVEPALGGTPKVFFTRASVGNRPDTLLATGSELITLGPDERSLTLSYAAPDYGQAGSTLYRVRLNGGAWGPLTASRSLTLFDLAPGRYLVEVESSDRLGRPSGRTGRMTIVVEPKFYETAAARVAFALIVLALAGAGVWLWLYVRGIRRKQRETLEAYLTLMESVTAPAEEQEAAESAPAQAPAPAPKEIDAADAAFMDRVMDYVKERLSDPDADVDDMARATGVSRSGLTRKMRQLMGVSPADFLRQTRMAHAATLLRTTDKAVKEVAWECGFADINYFGKCFKTHHGMTPTSFRKEEES